MNSSPPTSDSKTTLSRLELRCPPLPQTLMEAIDLVDTPEQLEVKPVTAMVERDPVVVARLLQTVNSAYYGLRRTISSVERAVVLLGPVAVTGIVVGMNMLKLRSVLEGPAAPSFTRLIRHSAATAFLTRHLYDGSPHDGRPDPARSHVGDSFTAGLLHDFGKIILVYNFPKEAHALYDERRLAGYVDEPDLRQVEQLLFGYDHTEAGEYASRKLNFPDELIDVIRLHHEPERARSGMPHVRLLRTAAAANMAAKAMGHAFTQPMDWETCLAQPQWQHYVKHHAPAGMTSDQLAHALADLRDHLDEYLEAMLQPVNLSGQEQTTA